MPKKVTQYMREQIAALDGEGLIEFIRKTKFTVEQRKLILRELGDIEADPRSTPAEIKTAEKAAEVLEEKKPLADLVKDAGATPVLGSGEIENKPELKEHRRSFKELTKEEQNKKKNRSFFEIPNFF